MPPTFIIFIAVTTVVSILISVIGNISSKRKQIAMLNANYGKPPVADDYIQFDSIGRYAQYTKTHNPSRQRVDSITWDDLEMNKVFNRINACQTSVGEEYLYNCLHELPLNGEALTRREGLIHFFANNPETRLAVQALLSSRMGKENYNGLTALMFAPEMYCGMICPEVTAILL